MSQANRRNATRYSEPSRVPAWVWLFTGAVLGAFIMFLMHLSDIRPGGGEQSSKESTSTAKEESKEQKPRFDFYELLKENEVPLPKQNETEKAATPKEKQEFLLQVASFKTAEDAEQLRAELILLNLDAYTENAKIRNGETWHRVMVGPFTSTSKLSKARSILLSHRHEALVLKRKPQS